MTGDWPALPYAAWKDTCATLHRWTQIVGKIRIARTPMQNHWWNATLRLTAHGLTTGPLPDAGRWFEIQFDFIDHLLILFTSEGEERVLALEPCSVSEFWADLFSNLRALGIDVEVSDRPTEITTEAIPFRDDRVHRAYEAEYSRRFWLALLATQTALERFASGFVGKASPVQFFWGTFDLSYARYSGRRAPPRPDADRVTREAYSHELANFGFWPGDERTRMAAFYAYFAPAPGDLDRARVVPESAFFDAESGLFLLPYEIVRRTDDSAAMLLQFFESVYDAGADLANWDRVALERQPPTAETREALAAASSPPPLGP
jgi:hypothetical protein